MQKSFLKFVIAGSLLLLIMHNTHAQIKNLNNQAHKIPDSLVEQKIIGTDTVTYIAESLLKEKYNLVTLSSGRFLCIEYKYGQVRGILIGDDKGLVNIQVAYQQKPNENVSFNPAACSCVGVKSCEEMFDKRLCKDNKICVGNICICTRPYDMKMKRLEND